jgi:hypothetical protein
MRGQLGQIWRWHVDVRCILSCIGVFYNENKNSTAFYLTCDHFRDMAQRQLSFNWFSLANMTHVEFINDVVHLHKH